MNQWLLASGALVLMGATSPALAVGKIYSPNVVKGELELEYSASRSFDNDRSKDNAQEHEFELEYGLTDRLVVEFAGELEKESGETLIGHKAEIGGRYQLFEQGEMWLDSGLMLAYGHALHEGDSDAIEAKLLLEKQHGKFLHLANIVLEQEVGSHATGGPERELLWSSRYRYRESIEPGFEIQSSFGKTNENHGFDTQEHYIGPAIYGKLLSNFKYEAAYLIGASDAAVDSAARILLEYEMHF